MPLPQTGLRLSWASWRWLRDWRWEMMSWEMPSTFIVFVTLHWTYSSMSLSLLYWGTPHCTPDVPHQCCGEWKNLPQPAGNASPAAAQDAVGLLCHKCTFLTSLPLSTQVNSLYLLQQSCFPANQPPAWHGRQGYSSLGTRFYISICWTSWDCCWHISPACQGPSKQQYNYQVYQALLPVLSKQTCWEHTLSQHQDSHEFVLVPGSDPG